MKKFTKIRNVCGGGVLILSAILAMSLAFASCSNSSDSNDSYPNPSPTLPKNVGENPIKKTTELKENVDSENEYYLLQLNTNDTAHMFINYKGKKEAVSQLKYTYNAEKKEIYMIVEKYWDITDYDSSELLAYGEIRSKIKDEAENQEQEEEGVNYLNVIFGAQITYTYDFDNAGKMTLTEKFTGVKNLLYSECKYETQDFLYYAGINNTGAYIEFREDGYSYYYSAAILDTDKKTIEFEKEKYKMTSPDGSEVESCGNVTAKYTEDFAAETVTINCEGEKYLCKFEGKLFAQE